MSHEAVTWALAQEAPMAAKFTLVGLASHAGDTWQAWPSVKTLAKYVNASERSVQRYLQELVDLGLVTPFEREAENKSRLPNGYQLMVEHFPVSLTKAGVRLSPGANLTPPGDTVKSPSPRHSYDPTPVTLVSPHIDEPSLEPSLEPSITSSSSCERKALEENPPKENPSSTVSPSLSTAKNVDWVERLAEAHRLADGAASMANGGTCHPAAFRRLCEPTVGTPCDWDLDVVPAIASKAAAAKKRNKPILDWSWVSDQAIENRDRRLAGLPAPDAQPMRTEGRRKESAAEKAARLFAQMEGTAA